MGKTKSLEEKVFYTLLSIKEKYTVRELRRQIDTSLYERQKLSNARLDNAVHPNAAIIPQIFRDKYIFEFLDLQEPYSETDLQKALVKRLKQFLSTRTCSASCSGNGHIQYHIRTVKTTALYASI